MHMPKLVKLKLTPNCYPQMNLLKCLELKLTFEYMLIVCIGGENKKTQTHATTTFGPNIQEFRFSIFF